MQLRDLEWVARLAETGHLTHAAAELGTTQPTLSRTLARVETELGAVLFRRTPTGVVPTPAGQVVARAATDLTDRYRRLREEVATLLDPDSGTVRLAFLDSIATSLVPGVLGDVHRRAPQLRVLLRQEPGHEMLADLAAGVVDLAITSPRPGAGHGWHPLQQERLVVVVPARHRLAGRARVRLAELDGEQLITTPAGFGSRAQVDGLLREAGAAVAISFESQDLATIEGLVAAGLGVAIVPEAFAGQSGTVGIAIRDPGARRSIGLTWRTDTPLSPPAARFRSLVTAPPDHPS